MILLLGLKADGKVISTGDIDSLNSSIWAGKLVQIKFLKLVIRDWMNKQMDLDRYIDKYLT